MPEGETKQDKRTSNAEAKQVVDVFHEISTLLNADLDRPTLSVCISLIENGVNPEALASVVKELKREADETRAANAGANQ